MDGCSWPLSGIHGMKTGLRFHIYPTVCHVYGTLSLNRILLHHEGRFAGGFVDSVALS